MGNRGITNIPTILFFFFFFFFFFFVCLFFKGVGNLTH